MKRKRILLVDDSSLLTQLFRLALEQTGRFIVKEENAGEKAVETARHFHPDLIFLDHDLPSQDGSDIVATLRADAELKSVPVAFITGSVRKEDAESDGLLGLRALAKPVCLGDLIAFATELLEGRPPQIKTAGAW